MGDYWGAYKALIQAFQRKYGIARYDLDMSSARLVRRLTFEQAHGTFAMDTGIVGITYGPQAKSKGLLSCYASKALPALPQWAYDPTNPSCPSWYATYYGTVAIGVNTAFVPEVPKGFKDLLSEKYKGKVVMMDPRESATGFATVAAATYALGGSLSHMAPGLRFFGELKRKGILLHSLKAQDLDAFVSGRYPIYFNYDYNFVKLLLTTHASLVTVIPQEGTIRYPYVNLIPKKSPHRQAMELLIDFILSVEGQQIVAENFLMPVRRDVPIPQKGKALLPSVPEEKLYNANWSQAGKALKETQAFWNKLYKKGGE